MEMYKKNKKILVVRFLIRINQQNDRAIEASKKGDLETILKSKLFISSIHIS